jgi:thiamine-monophosphate kinase
MANQTGSLGEFGRIERFFRPLARNFPGALSLDDDAAIISVPVGKELVVTTDAVVAGIHFLPSDTPADIARKALRVNLSDLAAKGACPLAYTLTLAIGRDVDDDWIEAFASALADDQTRYRIELTGGDSVSTLGPVWVSITAFGLVDSGRMVRRSGAQVGDRVLVTGTVGDAALGLAALQGRLGVSDEDRAELSSRYRLPQPRSDLAVAVADFAHAALDVSDGLAADFGHLCRASGVGGKIWASNVPLSPAATKIISADPSWLPEVLGGGDDYEILLTAPPGAVPALVAAATGVGIALTEIGVIEPGGSSSRADIVDDEGTPLALPKSGWTHS